MTSQCGQLWQDYRSGAMGANGPVTNILGWLTVGLILALNIVLLKLSVCVYGRSQRKPCHCSG